MTLILHSTKAILRRKSSDFQVCRSVRTPLSTSANAKAAPFRKALQDSFVGVQPVWLPHRLLSDRRLVVPSGSISAGSLDTARNPSLTTSLSRRLLQSAANIRSIRDRQ